MTQRPRNPRNPRNPRKYTRTFPLDHHRSLQPHTPLHRQLVPRLAFMCLLLLSASTVLAQDEEGRRQTLSVFSMFFFPLPSGADFLDWLGVIMIWIILSLSVVAGALIIHFWLKSGKNNIVPDGSRDFIKQAIDEKRYREALEFANSDSSFLGKLVAGALNQASNGFAAMERALEEVADLEITRMLRPIETLSVIGNVAPMLGLFGTVYGMIVAFQRLVMAGGQPDPAKLAGGISTALVTTFWGLVVAVPCITAYAVIRNRVDALTSESMITAEEVLGAFKPGGAKKPPAPGGSTPAAAQGAKPTPPPRATPKPG